MLRYWLRKGGGNGVLKPQVWLTVIVPIIQGSIISLVLTLAMFWQIILMLYGLLKYPSTNHSASRQVSAVGQSRTKQSTCRFLVFLKTELCAGFWVCYQSKWYPVDCFFVFESASSLEFMSKNTDLTFDNNHCGVQIFTSVSCHPVLAYISFSNIGFFFGG